ncbi:MAG: rhomboid family intramembrane serine protease [Candidatus Aenigmarchaeota archaeon]|nr:rhomboid family intramembrane serine protease [Candidatus Aenigmarchaeota archaeon]
MRLNTTLILLAAIIIAFGFQTVFGITDNFALVAKDIAARPWILVTSVFLHSGPEHLVSNAFALVLFGLALESIIDGRRFATIFFVSGIAASIGSSLIYPVSLGASGAIFGIIGALTMLRPKMAVYAFGIPLPMVVASLLWALLDLGGLFYPSGTANLAHLVGLAAGLTAGFSLRNTFKEPAGKKEKVLTEKELDDWEESYMGRRKL